MKNYIVKMDNIGDSQKGLIKYVKYLTDKTHKHHTNTKQLKELINNDKSFFRYAKTMGDNAELRNAVARKGGKPISNYAKSLTLDFPPFVKHPADEAVLRMVLGNVASDIFAFINQSPLPPKKPKDDSEEALKRYNKNLKEYEKRLSQPPIEFEEFKKSIYAVWHNQKNEHIHLTLSSYIGKTNIRAYKSKAFVNMVKKSFTAHVDEQFNRDIDDYTPKTSSKAYTKAEVLKDKEYVNKTIRVLRALVLRLLKKYPQDEKYLNKIINDLEKGHTNKAQKKLDKFSLKHDL